MYIILLKMVGGMKSMKTLDMMIEAKETQEWYNTGDMWYHFEKGFVDDEMKPCPENAFKQINTLMEYNWERIGDPPIIMTRREVEEKYGIVIID